MEEVRPLNVLIDINVLLDVLLGREPWFRDSRAIGEAHQHRAIIGHVAAHGLTNLFYIARRIVGIEIARKAVRSCLETFEVLSVGRPEIELADSFDGEDLEDNLVLACAIGAGLEAIVTRDPREFGGSTIPVLTPAELASRIASGEDRR